MLVDYDGWLTIDNFIAQQIDLELTCLASNHLLIVSRRTESVIK